MVARSGKSARAEADADKLTRTVFPDAAEERLKAEFFGSPRGFFVDVGANDPQSGSQSLALEQAGWHGVLIEPQPDLAAKLQAGPRARGSLRRRVPRRAMPARPCRSISPACSPRWTAALALTGTRPQGAVEVPIRTLDDMLTEAAAPSPIDFLSIDIEGHEIEAFAGFDFARWRPRLILMEDHVTSLAKHRLLLRSGYRLIRRTGLNGWYVPAEAAPGLGFLGRWSLVRKYYLALPIRMLRELKRRLPIACVTVEAPSPGFQSDERASDQPRHAGGRRAAERHHHHRNEAANIGECLDSLAFCDERIVVDCGSSDGTLLIAREKGARVAFHDWKGFGAQKNYALSLAQGAGCSRSMPTSGSRRSLRKRSARRSKAADADGFEMLRAFEPFAATRCAGSGGIARLCPPAVPPGRRGSPTIWCTNGSSATARSAASASPLLHHSVRKLEDAMRRMDGYSTLSAEQIVPPRAEVSFAHGNRVARRVRVLPRLCAASRLLYMARRDSCRRSRSPRAPIIAT